MRSIKRSTLIRLVLVGLVIGSGSLAPIQLDVADAATTGRASATTASFSSGSFRLHATTSPSGAVTGTALVLANSSAAQFFYLRNTGTMQINSFTMTVTGSAGGSIFTYRRCDANVAFTALNTCASGSFTTLTLSSNVGTLTIPAGTNFHIQITPNKTTTPTINITVSRSRASAGTTTNS